MQNLTRNSFSRNDVVVASEVRVDSFTLLKKGSAKVINSRSRILLLLILFFASCRYADKPGEYGAAENTVTQFRTGGHVGDRLAANQRTWLQPLLDNNPNLFGAFLEPETNKLSKCKWHGEFPGKILTGMAQTYLTSHDPRTRAVGDRMVELLGESQWEDGYLGPWAASKRFDNPPDKWDTWGHYHCMYGLFRWYEITGNEQALAITLKAADCI